MASSGLLAVLALAGAAAPPGRDPGVARTPIDAGPPAAEALTATSYPNAAAALRALLGAKPRVIAFGEFHQTKATVRIPSALKRFTRNLLGPLREAGATDLVAETWITTGACGEVEKKAVAQVDKATRRPARTENEVVTLLRRAKAAGIMPRILEVGCKDYQTLMGGAEVDFDRLLRLTREQLEKQILAALARPGSRMVLSYGGALHNDLEPSPELAPYSFGPAVSAVVGGRYLEIDLYVPEFIAKNALVTAQPWYPVYRRAYRRGRVTLVRRGESSYVIVFPRMR